MRRTRIKICCINSTDDVKLVQVIHVIDKESVDLAIKLSQDVDALLLDSGNPNLAVKGLGNRPRARLVAQQGNP